jgi:hypothetical protein
MRRLFLGFVIACTVSLSARATVVLSLDLRELVARSERVVRGHVTAQRSFWDDAHRGIFTDVTIRVDATFKGEPVQSLVVRRLGGSVGGIGMRTIGEVEFGNGEEVFLFLRRRMADTYQTVGLAQGKLHIVRDAAGARAVTNLQGARLLGEGQPAVRMLGELERDVRALAGAAR